LCIDIHPNFRKSIKRYAQQDDKTMKEWITEAIRQYMELKQKGLI
jgi:Leu/Phe-tRNA-protein transferase